MEFLKGILIYFLFLFMMIVDNLFWIGASPEYYEYKKYSLLEKGKYILFKRVIPVLTAWRDAIPALITAFLGVLLL